jgi:hypothetical protein
MDFLIEGGGCILWFLFLLGYVLSLLAQERTKESARCHKRSAYAAMQRTGESHYNWARYYKNYNLNKYESSLTIV